MMDAKKNNKYPLTPQEAYFTQPEPLFPRHILQPLYEQYIRAHPPYDEMEYKLSGFFNFLLTQSKEANPTNRKILSAKEVLYNKARQKNDGFMAGQFAWVVEAMEEYAMQNPYTL